MKIGKMKLFPTKLGSTKLGSTIRPLTVLSGMAVVLFGFGLGCSEAVPPANQGAVSAQFVTSSAAGTPGSCNIAPHPFQLGVTDPSDTGQIIFLRDGEAKALVFCSVVAEGNGFNAAAEIEDGPRSFKFTVNGISSANTPDNPAMGSVTYRSVETVNFFTSTNDVPCEFWLNDSQEVAEGRVWMQYRCPLIQYGTNDCSLGESTIAMQNCDS
jgi:hypothetical protein